MPLLLAGIPSNIKKETCRQKNMLTFRKKKSNKCMKIPCKKNVCPGLKAQSTNVSAVKVMCNSSLFINLIDAVRTYNIL
jgi:hypothetical protein